MIIDKSKKGTIILSHYRSGGTQLKSIILSAIGDQFPHNYIGEINFDELNPLLKKTIKKSISSS